MRVVFAKEARDLVRDRRTLLCLFAPPILGPLLGLGGILFLVWQVARQAPDGMIVAVQGGEQLPGLVEYLDSGPALNLVPPPEDPLEDLRVGELMALLTLPPDAAERAETEQPITITLTTSQAGWMPSVASLAVRGKVLEYNREILDTRLALRGLAPEWVQPLRLVETNPPSEGLVAPLACATGESLARSANGLLIPFFVASWSMGGGLGLIAYMTVGEKEKNTMEALLTTVASRVGIVLGKISLSMIISLATVILWAIDGLIYLLLLNAPASLGSVQPMALGLQTQAFGLAGIWLLLLMLPLMTMTSGATAAACTFARNYREASLFISLLQLGLPGLSFAAVFIAPAVAPPLTYAMPIFGTLVAVRDLFLGGLEPSMLLLAGATSVAYATLSILLAAFVFSREWALMRGV
jgi:sodium transport system permease protein